MPPPSTFLGDVRHHTSLARHRAGHFARRNAEQLTFLVKLAIFLAKMATLSRACWPYSVDLGVSAGLVALAALDLGLPLRFHMALEGGGSGTVSSADPVSSGGTQDLHRSLSRGSDPSVLDLAGLDDHHAGTGALTPRGPSEWGAQGRNRWWW